MKTYALVDIGSLQHMTSEIDHAHEMQADAQRAGQTLILVKPMQTTIGVQQSAAIERAVAANVKPTDPWSLIMSALDDLRSAVAGLTAEVADSSAKFKAIADKLAATPAGNDDEIKAITAEILTVTAALDTATADAKAADPAPVDAPAEPTP